MLHGKSHHGTRLEIDDLWLERFARAEPGEGIPWLPALVGRRAGIEEEPTVAAGQQWLVAVAEDYAVDRVASERGGRALEGRSRGAVAVDQPNLKRADRDDQPTRQPRDHLRGVDVSRHRENGRVCLQLLQDRQRCQVARVEDQIRLAQRGDDRLRERPRAGRHVGIGEDEGLDGMHRSPTSGDVKVYDSWERIST